MRYKSYFETHNMISLDDYKHNGNLILLSIQSLSHMGSSKYWNIERFYYALDKMNIQMQIVELNRNFMVFFHSLSSIEPSQILFFLPFLLTAIKVWIPKNCWWRNKIEHLFISIINLIMGIPFLENKGQVILIFLWHVTFNILCIIHTSSVGL